MPDRTADWKTAVKKGRGGKSVQSDLIKPVSADKDGFSKSASAIMSNIKTVRQFLNEHKIDYLNMSRLSRRASGMTDQERRELEEETALFIDECVSRIEALHRSLSAHDRGHAVEDGGAKWHTDTGNRHLREHRGGVMSFLHHKLKEVSSSFESMRHLRRSQTNANQTLQSTIAPTRSHYTASASRPDLVFVPTVRKPDQDSNGQPLSEEMQLEAENEALLKELECTMDQVQETESRVAQIAHLGRLLGNEVVSQAHDIDTLYDQAIESSENIKKGNEELKKATKQGVTFRIWVLFFLALASLSLLFLHWFID